MPYHMTEDSPEYMPVPDDLRTQYFGSSRSEAGNSEMGFYPRLHSDHSQFFGSQEEARSPTPSGSQLALDAVSDLQLHNPCSCTICANGQTVPQDSFDEPLTQAMLLVGTICCMYLYLLNFQEYLEGLENYRREQQVHVSLQQPLSLLPKITDMTQTVQPEPMAQRVSAMLYC